MSGLVAVLALTVTAVRAQATEPEGDRSGLYLRGTAGLGGASLYLSNSYTAVNNGGARVRHQVEADQTGVSTSFDLAVGGFIAPTVAMHLELGVLWLPSPSSKYRATWAEESATGTFEAERSTEVDGSLLSGSVRLGFTGYLMPAGAYVGGSIGVNWLSLGAGWSEVDAGVGVSATLRLGKEWTLDEHWSLGLGLLLECAVRRIPEEQYLELTSTTATGNLGRADAQMPVFSLGVGVSVVWN